MYGHSARDTTPTWLVYEHHGLDHVWSQIRKLITSFGKNYTPSAGLSLRMEAGITTLESVIGIIRRPLDEVDVEHLPEMYKSRVKKWLYVKPVKPVSSSGDDEYVPDIVFSQWKMKIADKDSVDYYDYYMGYAGMSNDFVGVPIVDKAHVTDVTDIVLHRFKLHERRKFVNSVVWEWLVPALTVIAVVLTCCEIHHFESRKKTVKEKYSQLVAQAARAAEGAAAQEEGTCK